MIYDAKLTGYDCFTYYLAFNCNIRLQKDLALFVTFIYT